MKAYSVLAKYYDTLMQDFDYQTYLQFLTKTLKGKNGVDLCCGSGKITTELAKLGYNMIGVDTSSEMLTVATQNSKKAGQNVLYVCEDVKTFEVDRKKDFFICVCDGFNYINFKNLKAIFATIFNNLLAEGSFIFDISTFNKLTEVLGNNVFFEDYDNFTYLWTNKLSTEGDYKVKMDLIFFEKEGELFKKLEESHTQYCHKTCDILKLLQEIGFNVEVFGENFKKYTSKSARAIFNCTKKQYNK